MWASIWSGLYQTAYYVILHGCVFFFPLLFRGLMFSLRTGFALAVSYGLLLIFDPLLVAAEGVKDMIGEANFEPFVAAFNFANTWLPLSELLAAVKFVASVKFAAAAVKIIGKIWSGIPFLPG